jgi:hypothetical protein
VNPYALPNPPETSHDDRRTQAVAHKHGLPGIGRL